MKIPYRKQIVRVELCYYWINVERSQYQHDSRCEINPAEIEESRRLSSDHLLNAIAEFLTAENPRYRYGLKEN